MTFILADACVVTVNGARDIFDRARVLVREDRVAEIGTAATLTARAPEAEVIDCADNIVMPGKLIRICSRPCSRGPATTSC